ncbi:Chromodomain helicase DNA binding protein [Bonamia ostreae]|uniref:Chromodomain helicase DNA binding protein n=1 Tax=Bonamia ostreae TaxID=126728 RepID=A0ABV2APM7_9EUKA
MYGRLNDFSIYNQIPKRTQFTAKKKSLPRGPIAIPVYPPNSRKSHSKLIVDKILHQRRLNGTFEYFCTFKDLSKIHSEWLKEDVLKTLGSHAKNKFSRFKEEVNYFWSEGDPLFGEEIEPERILAGRPSRHSLNEERYEYFVKWVGQPFSSCTWDYEEDINNPEIFRRFKQINDQSRKTTLENAINADLGSFDENRKIDKSYRHENRLRDWQISGAKWLIRNWHNKTGCILADEMGLGKTIQAIALIDYIATCFGNGPFLVVCPLSSFLFGNFQPNN